jgi:L-seryl-tRNA(Ser) seleniumtransferase
MASFRELPSVDQVLRSMAIVDVPQEVVADEIRAELAERRDALKRGIPLSEKSVERAVRERVKELMRPSLRPVINATGVVLHTNLGRAPLPRFEPLPGYSNLEYDLKTGKRGKRDVHTATLLERLIHRPAILVNNNAAAVFLVLHELAAGYEVIVSRGELIEIGDGFRIPEIMARSGAMLREVGTTNRTHIDDYRAAINERTRLIMRVHPSNFKVSGFTSRPELTELAALGHKMKVPVYEDLGSGCLTDLRSQGIDEPLVAESVDSGVNILSFSCDKLLGGPQTGIIAGDEELVARVRRNPMYRAFRVDKLIVQALETALRNILLENWQAMPALRMIFASSEEIRARAERVAAQLNGACVRESESPIGGGSTPDQTMPTWVVELEVESASIFEAKLRAQALPVVARIERDRIILDMRTVADSEVGALIAAVQLQT